jgi:hypothetical protein
LKIHNRPPIDSIYLNFLFFCGMLLPLSLQEAQICFMVNRRGAPGHLRAGCSFDRVPARMLERHRGARARTAYADLQHQRFVHLSKNGREARLSIFAQIERILSLDRLRGLSGVMGQKNQLQPLASTSTAHVQKAGHGQRKGKR